MSVFQVSRNEKKESFINIQSKVVEYQVLSEKPLYPIFEFKNNFIENNAPELFSQNIIEQPKKKCSRKEINSFYSRIKYIRKKYNIKKSRKNHIDSLVKKAKSKFLKGIYEGLKYCLNSYINRLPQKFIINTKIEYNKKYLNLTVEEIYSEFKLLPTLDIMIESNMVQKDKKDLLYLLMKTKLKDIYKLYINSDLYLYEKRKIEKKAGIGVAQLYDFVATNICEYFLLNKGNHRNNYSNINKKFSKSNNDYSCKKMKIINNKNIYVKFNILKIENNPVVYNK
jgi:hypothetical protein